MTDLTDLSAPLIPFTFGGISFAEPLAAAPWVESALLAVAGAALGADQHALTADLAPLPLPAPVALAAPPVRPSLPAAPPVAPVLPAAIAAALARQP